MSVVIASTLYHVLGFLIRSKNRKKTFYTLNETISDLNKYRIKNNVKNVCCIPLLQATNHSMLRYISIYIIILFIVL